MNQTYSVNNLADLKKWNTQYTLLFNSDLLISNTDNFKPINLVSQNVLIDGQGHTLNIDIQGSFWIGFLALGANVRNITVKNLIINFISPCDLQTNVGSLISVIQIQPNQPKPLINISKCSIAGQINLSGAGCGGFVGRGGNVIIDNSCCLCNISGIGAGGIVGTYCTGSIMSSFSSGQITGLGSGGIVGSYSRCTILICYSTGNITNSSGGIAGINMLPSYIAGCYSLGDISISSGGIIAGGSSRGTIIYNSYVYGLISQDSAGIGGLNCKDITISYCYSLTSIDAEIGPGGLIISGTIFKANNVGFGASEDWTIPSSQLFLSTGYLINTITNKENRTITNIWSDSAYNSPPILTGPPILTAFTKSPWNHTTFMDSDIPSYDGIPVIPQPEPTPPPTPTPTPQPDQPSQPDQSNTTIIVESSWHIWVTIFIVFLILIVVIFIVLFSYYYTKYQSVQNVTVLKSGANSINKITKIQT